MKVSKQALKKRFELVLNSIQQSTPLRISAFGLLSVIFLMLLLLLVDLVTGRSNLPTLRAADWLVSLLLTLILVSITLEYTIATATMVRAAQEQVTEAQKQLAIAQEQLNLEYEPNLVLTLKEATVVEGGDKVPATNKIEVWLVNLGRYPVYINHVQFSISIPSTTDVFQLFVNGEVLASSASYKLNNVSFEGSEAPKLYFAGHGRHTDNPIGVRVHFEYGTTANKIHLHEFQIQAEYVPNLGFHLQTGLIKKEVHDGVLFTSIPPGKPLSQ